MPKKGVSAISGNISPVVGEKNTYHVSDWYPDTPSSERDLKAITWELFRKRSNGKFTTTHIRKKGDSSFTFGEASLGHTYRLEGYLHEPEGGGLIITPKPNKIPQICRIELCYIDDHAGRTFSFMEKLRAKAYCVNMFNKEIVFTLWEDDAKGPGHQASNAIIETQKARIDENGLAILDFILTKALMKKAMRGETNAQELEFYVTVEYYKHNKHATENVEVENPYAQYYNPKPYQPPVIPKAKGSPAEQKPASQKEEKGIVDTAIDKMKELWDWRESKGTATKEKSPTILRPEGRSAVIVSGVKPKSAPNCGEKYCIKKGDKSELIREINIRLAGFGGNIPTDEFTDRTEKMIKQFQRDYMKVSETGKVCGNVLRAIDEFSRNFDIMQDVWSELKCSCEKKGKKVKSKLRGIEEINKCNSFGDHTGANISPEKLNKYEYPGIHRSLLFGLKAILFYLNKQKTYSFSLISSGYRCRFKNYITTNHQGKAIDIQFNKGNWKIRGQLYKNIAELEKIRSDIFYKYLNAKTSWTHLNHFSLEPIGLNTNNTTIDGNHTYSWIHMDVRAFEKDYLKDQFFCKNPSSLNGKNLIQLALELGNINLCSCYETFQSQKNTQQSKSLDYNCEEKFKRVAPIILKHEGGYINDPNDSGGATNKGITIGIWKQYAKSDLGVEPTLDNLKNITNEQATLIYRKRYWEAKGFCEIEDISVSLMVYDWSITSGGAAKEVQRLLVNEFNQNISIDGGIGKQTITAINNVEDQDKLLKRIGEIRKQYYTDLSYDYNGKPTKNLKFLKGWHNRVDDCLNYTF